MKKNTWRYEVRTKGDGEFEYYVEANTEHEFKYDDRNLRSSRAYAKKVDGWVVKIIEITM